MKYFILGLKNYFTVEGRSSRKEYWMFVLFNILFGSPIELINGLMGVTYSFLSIIWQLFMIIPSFCIAVRRMHDVGKSGWYIFIPIYNFILAVTEGDKGDNQYGSPSGN